MSMVLRQFLLKARPPVGKPVANRVYTRHYSQDLFHHGRRPDPIRKRPLIDKTSGTLLGVTAGLLMGGFYVTHLESAPETGRRRFMAVSKNQEELIRQQALQETVQQFQGKILPLHHPLTQEVRRITRRIITASNLGYLHGDLEHTIGDPFADSWGGDSAAEIPRTPSMNADREWVVLVVDDMKFVNAFAAPGLVCVSTGIMPVARDEEGLAAVIGHEIGHVAMRHSAEHLSQYKLLLPVIGILLLLGLDLALLLSDEHPALAAALARTGNRGRVLMPLAALHLTPPQRTSSGSNSCPAHAIIPLPLQDSSKTSQSLRNQTSRRSCAHTRRRRPGSRI